MIRVILIVFFLGAHTISGFSQSKLNNYSYVIVPERYDFLSEKDEFQLNSITKFLLNKYGFNAYFEDELPKIISRCDGLKVSVENDGGFIYTKLAVIFKDCDGNEIYRSPQGKSKIKDFRQAYSQALRRAFEHVKRLGVKQKAFKNQKEITEEKTENKIQDESITKTRKYAYKEYVLIPNETGYTLWKNNKIIGEAIPASDNRYFVLKTSEFIGIGIQTEDIFTIERYEANKPKLFPMLFKLEKNQ